MHIFVILFFVFLLRHCPPLPPLGFHVVCFLFLLFFLISLLLRLLFRLGEIAKVIEAKGVAGQRRQQPTLSRTVDIQVFVRVVVFRLDPRPRRLPQRIHIDIGYAQAGQMAAPGRCHNLEGIALQADRAAIATMVDP